MLAVAPPGTGEVEVLVRVVPLVEVFALEETPVDALVVVSTVVVEPTLAEVDSAELALVVEAVKVVVGVAVFVNADVVEAGAATPLVADGASSELPGGDVLPDPAPKLDPAVFDCAVAKADDAPALRAD
jgi:hypothetical protein